MRVLCLPFDTRCVVRATLGFSSWVKQYFSLLPFACMSVVLAHSLVFLSLSLSRRSLSLSVSLFVSACLSFCLSLSLSLSLSRRSYSMLSGFKTIWMAHTVIAMDCCTQRVWLHPTFLLPYFPDSSLPLILRSK